MPEQNNHYEYGFEGSPSNSYIFLTKDDIRYEIKFVPSTDYFNGYPDLEADVFEMVISVTDNPTGGKLPADLLVAPTIFAVFENFFLPLRHALVFICDSSDGRVLARHRKFGLWFYSKTRTTNELAKFDREIIDGDTTIMLSLILSSRHPQRSLIVDIFWELGEEEK